jgi:hypothetical protein
MNSPQTLHVTISNIRGNTSTGTVELKVWDKKERTTRALKALGMTWGLAIISILIPILHFILVPTLILAGPIVFSWIAGQERVILGGKGTCPECNKEFEIVRSPAKWPLSDICNHCKAELKIEQEGAVSAPTADQV